jgi:RNA polymerase sigma factor (sigma-70 family)
MPTDDQLLVAALAGSDREAALAECIRRFGPMIRRTAWRITSDEHRADDVCQAVFLVLLRKAARVAGHPAPSAWLYYVTVTIARDAVKSETRRRRREQEAVMVALAQRKPLTRLPTGIDQAIVRLPEIYRRVLVAHYLEGHSHAAVAAELGVSEEIVRKRASRGIERLRKSLAGTALASVTVAGLAGLLSAEAAAAAPLAAAQVAAIQAAAAGAASVQVSALAAAGTKALLWAKLKIYAAIAASVAVVAVPSYVLLKPADNGLVGHYTLAEGTGTVVKDASSSGNHGTLVGGVTWATGPKPGSKALSFDGKTGYVRVDKNLNQWLGGTATVAFWLKTTQVGVATWPRTGVTGVNVQNGDNDVQWGFLDDAGKIAVCAGDPAYGRGEKKLPELMAKSPQRLNDGLWHHVALTREATLGRLQVYVDGKLSTTLATAAKGIKTTPFFSIGRVESIPDEAKSDFYFQGLLHEVRFYNRALSASEIEALSR